MKLLSFSSLRPSWIFGLSPGGLATDGYDGHVFWDQETWMFPPLVLLHQDLARTCLAYRFERLQAAEDKAKKYGFKGRCKNYEFICTLSHLGHLFQLHFIVFPQAPCFHGKVL